MAKRLPKNAKIVNKGIIFDTYHWEQEQFDGSIKIFEAIKRNPTVQIFAITKEKKNCCIKRGTTTCWKICRSCWWACRRF